MEERAYLVSTLTFLGKKDCNIVEIYKEHALIILPKDPHLGIMCLLDDIYKILAREENKH